MKSVPIQPRTIRPWMTPHPRTWWQRLFNIWPRTQKPI